MTNADKVKDFRAKFELTDPMIPTIISDQEFLFRYNLILEETGELLLAHRQRDIVRVADALADLLYVTYGIAHEYGIPIDAVFAEVHRANMQKVRSKGPDDPLGRRHSGSDVVKPPGFKPPDVAGVLGIDDRG